MRQSRKRIQIKIIDSAAFLKKALYWANTFDQFAYFNSNSYSFPNQPFKDFIAVGAFKTVSLEENRSFSSLQRFIDQNKDYLIGHFSYDLKNEIEKLESKNECVTEFEPASFFIPITIIHLEEQITIESLQEPEKVFQEINSVEIPFVAESYEEFKTEVSRDIYIKQVNGLKEHIIEGDIYEINYCHQYKAEDITIDPIKTYLELNRLAPAPFSTLYKTNDNYLLSASPERFIKKESDDIISQPIKGTAPRSTDRDIDEELKRSLKENKKERAENMMIVDLVRNDLAKSCQWGSVAVEEMFGVYSFPLWHQMISTVRGKIKEEVSSIQCIKNAFPMGSMTGAPKIIVMDLIERFEVFKRNIYSGSVGYFLPNGNFDFNVVIRSLTYNSQTNKASFAVGSAITYDSDPEQEYDECMLKAKTFTSLFKITD